MIGRRVEVELDESLSFDAKWFGLAWYDGIGRCCERMRVRNNACFGFVSDENIFWE